MVVVYRGSIGFARPNTPTTFSGVTCLALTTSRMPASQPAVFRTRSAPIHTSRGWVSPCAMKFVVKKWMRNDFRRCLVKKEE